MNKNSTLHYLDPKKMVAVHASSVRVNGGALLFLGPSEAGKSTICRLLSGFTQLVADDVAYLAPGVSGEWEIFDTNGYESSLSRDQIFARDRVPLRAIFRLCQASQPRIQRIDELELCHHMTTAFFEAGISSRGNTRAKKLAFSQLSTIVRSIPGYRLHFDLSPKTAEAVAAIVESWQVHCNN